MPPFFVPILAFILWALAVLYYFPVLKLGLNLSDQVLAPHLFVSCLILILAWALSGPMTAAILSFLAAVFAIYLVLGSKEPALFLQLFIYAVLFVFMVYYLYGIQKRTNDKKILREKLVEEITLSEEGSRKKDLLKKALEEKIERLLNLQSFSEGLREGRDLQEVGRKIVTEIYQVLGNADQCALYLVDEARQELSLVASAKPEGEVIKEKEGSLFDQWVMKRSQAILVEDSENDFRFPKEALEDAAHHRSLCASPLITENKVLGVVRASSGVPNTFSTDDLRLLDIFSSLGAVTLRNILLYQKTEELAIRDSLTGLYLNRYFQERLSEEIRRAHFGQSAFSLLLIDLDFFKRYNDDYGHAAGDMVLRNVTAIISKCVQPVGFVARYGGEEFVVLLPSKGKRAAMNAAEKIRAEIEKARFLVRRVEGRVTVSIGVTAFPQGGRTREELIWAVDKNLYEAKSGGRNRVCGSI